MKWSPDRSQGLLLLFSGVFPDDLTATIDTARRLCLCWGTRSVVVEQPLDEAGAVVAAVKAAVGADLVLPQDPIVVAAGIPFSVAGSTNFIRVAVSG